MKIYDWVILGENAKGMEYITNHARSDESILWLHPNFDAKIWLNPLETYKKKSSHFASSINFQRSMRLLEADQVQVAQLPSLKDTILEFIRKIPELNQHYVHIEALSQEFHQFSKKLTSSKGQNLLSDSFWQLPPKLHQLYLEFSKIDERKRLSWELLASASSDQILCVAQSEVHRRYLFISLFFAPVQCQFEANCFEQKIIPLKEINIKGLMGAFWEITAGELEIKSKKLILNDDSYWRHDIKVNYDHSSPHSIKTNSNRIATSDPISQSLGWRDKTQPLVFWSRDSFSRLIKYKPHNRLGNIQGIKSAYFAYPRAMSALRD